MRQNMNFYKNLYLGPAVPAKKTRARALARARARKYGTLRKKCC